MKLHLPGMYILDDVHNPVAIDDAREWARFYEDDSKRQIAFDEGDGWSLSSIFLGVAHSPRDGDKPILFETALFDGTGRPPDMWRFTSWDECQRFHTIMLAGLLARSKQ